MSHLPLYPISTYTGISFIPLSLPFLFSFSVALTPFEVGGIVKFKVKSVCCDPVLQNKFYSIMFYLMFLYADREAVKKLSRDAMYKLEHGVDDTKKLKKAAPSLGKIAEIQSAKKDDYAQSQALRKKFRVNINISWKQGQVLVHSSGLN